jgi:hypothetical protein
MRFKTPKAKVYGYRAMLGIQYGAAALFGVLGFFRFINPSLGEVGAVLLLVTVFASSKNDFAKEAKKVIQFQRDGHPWDKFPTTDAERDMCRRELRPQLVLSGMNMIRLFKEVKKFEKVGDELGLKAAEVNYGNAETAFYQRWRAYEGADVLPFRDGEEPWKSPQEFIAELQRRMKLNKHNKIRICA